MYGKTNREMSDSIGSWPAILLKTMGNMRRTSQPTTKIYHTKKGFATGRTGTVPSTNGSVHGHCVKLYN